MLHGLGFRLIVGSLIALLIGAACSPLRRVAPNPGPELRAVTGRYRNERLGFSVAIPTGLVGYVIEGPLPAIGVRMYLAGTRSDPPVYARLDIFAEQNSQQWSTPAEGIRWAVGCEDRLQCESTPIRDVMLGSLPAASAAKTDGDYATEVVLAFAPGRNLGYWVWLGTERSRYLADRQVLEQLLPTFQLHDMR